MPDNPAQYSNRHTASEVEILRQRVRTLEAALRPFAKHGRRLQPATYSRAGFFTHCFPWEMWNAAAEAMGEGDNATP